MKILKNHSFYWGFIWGAKAPCRKMGIFRVGEKDKE